MKIQSSLPTRIHRFSRTLLLHSSLGLAALSAHGGESLTPAPQVFVDYAKDDVVQSWLKRSNVSLSVERQFFKQATVKWDWTAEETLDYTREFAITRSASQVGILYSPIFLLYTDNASPSDGVLRVELTDTEGRQAHFDVSLKHRGHRATWVRYTDMTGDQLGTQIKSFRLRAPQQGKGTLYLGTLVPNGNTYEALVMPSDHVPYVMDGEDEHRGAGVHRSHLDAIKLSVPVEPATAAAIQELEKIESRLETALLHQKHAKFAQVKKFYDACGIAQGEQGKEICFGREFAPFSAEVQKQYIAPNTVRFAFIGNMLNDLALIIRENKNPAEVAEAKTMVAATFKQLQAQGWVSGHSRGSIHNVGYNIKTFMSALYLLRDELDTLGVREHFTQLTQFITNAREVLMLPPNDANMDHFHTLAREQLVSLLLTKDSNERVAWVKAYAHYTSVMLEMRTNDDRDGFKYDGTAFHHYGHYPDYAMGAIGHAAELLYIFHNTTFAFSPAAKANLKQATMMMRVYANKYDLPNNLQGRHPFSDFSLHHKDVKEAYYYLTKTGDKGRQFDPEAAAAYLRLYGKDGDQKLISALEKAGIQPESDPHGHWVMNNAANSIHRRDDWMVAVKGYSKYVWCGETWDVANRYGGFASHGAVDIFTGAGKAASGCVQDGWDWTKLPGTTSLEVPLEILLQSIEMHKNKRSQETFAGGVKLGEQGIFGMVLNDPFHDLYARKSVFCFDNRIVCLGSNISNIKQNYHTTTTLFQNALNKVSRPNWIDSPTHALSELPLTVTREAKPDSCQVLGDTIGNSYFVRQGKLVVSRRLQHSLTQDKGLPTQNHFATAWLDHGKSPKNAQYEYSVLVQGSAEEIDAQSKQSPYTVLQHDSRAHVVYDKASKITGAVLFEEGSFDLELIKEVSQPVLVMHARQDDGSIKLSLCDPDLKWRDAQPESVIYVSVAGSWKIASGEGVSVVKSDKDSTLIKVKTKEGRTVPFTLQPKA
ncbi:MAG: hypothetical protein H7A51_14945 [Akkermansiaceae bacterium]|nr:hypothetical protein [Akkermansiaceae bacterium]